MNMWLQYLLAFTLKSRGRPRLALDDVARTPFRVLPTDIDMLGHLNNGRYLTYMDLGRVDFINRTGALAAMTRRKIYPVVGQASMAYRRSLDLWKPFAIETAIIGADERGIYLEQRFVVGGEVHARGVVQGRFIQRGHGALKIPGLVDVLAEAGIDVELPPMPEDAALWSQKNALPPSKAPAPSDWGGRKPR